MQWQKGQSANPGGKSERMAKIAAIRQAAMEFAPDALLRLSIEMNEGDTSAARISAARTIVEYAIGKPIQPVQTEEQTERMLTNDERRENTRALVAAAFAKVIEHEPELTPHGSATQS